MRSLPNRNNPIVFCALAALTTLFAAPVARAEESLPRPWATRADGHAFAGPGLFAPAVGSVGGTVQRRLLERVAVEGSVGIGVGDDEDPDSNGSGGFMAAATLRGSPLISGSGVHALSTASGLATILDSAHGDLHFVFGELGYELRATQGLTVLLALGPNWLLSEPEQATCGDNWFCTEFRQGDLALAGHVRLGAGWAF